MSQNFLIPHICSHFLVVICYHFVIKNWWPFVWQIFNEICHQNITTKFFIAEKFWWQIRWLLLSNFSLLSSNFLIIKKKVFHTRPIKLKKRIIKTKYPNIKGDNISELLLYQKAIISLKYSCIKYLHIDEIIIPT